MLDSWFYQNFINTSYFVIFVFIVAGGISAYIIYLSGKSPND